MRRLTAFALALVFLLAACARQGDGAASAVESYLQALANKDSSRLSALSCADWEESALTELDSFQAVDVKLENAACASSGTQGDVTLVSCQGKMIATYGAEDQDLDLSTRTFEVIQKGGEWLVCGGQ